MDPLTLESAALSADGRSLVILDQTLLPGEVRYLSLTETEDIVEAIRALRVRGAPAIGVAAAYGLYLAAQRLDAEDMDQFLSGLRRAAETLNGARPTAVNLSWALARMVRAAEASRALPVDEVKALLRAEADAIRTEDIAISREIGRLGFGLLRPGDGILTHCNAGALATGGYGTALGVIRAAHAQGKVSMVYADETRPLLQGARLTAYELTRDQIPVTLICDNMAGALMAQGKVDLVVVGCDRMAANGDFANKIGTSGVAILAKHYGIPFYVCAPSSTIDMGLAGGDQIPIEERPAGEVTELWYARRMAPEGVKVDNPAFDVTDHALVTGFITEKGIAYPPFDKAFRDFGF